MEIEKRVQQLEGEFKLIKGEVKQSLTDIRDYMVEGHLMPQVRPLEEPKKNVPALSVPESEQHEVPEPFRELPARDEIEEIIEETTMPARDEPPFESLADIYKEPGEGEEIGEEKDSLAEEGFDQPADSPVEQPLSEAVAEPWETLEEEQPPCEAAGKRYEIREEEGSMERTNGSILQANQLPNLIRWVSAAKKELGSAQLPTFLEAYGVRGQLSPQMKEIILHLAAVVSEEGSGPSPADVWSRLTLELHGILTDGSH